MPSPLETLVKILKLEREQGCINKAVIGGLSAFSENWQRQALPQARRPEHQVLTEELADILRTYDSIDNKAERIKQITYMLDRITGRAPVPPAYQERLAGLRAAAETAPPAAPESAPTPPPVERRERRERERPERLEPLPPEHKDRRENQDAAPRSERHDPERSRRDKPQRERPPRDGENTAHAASGAGGSTAESAPGTERNRPPENPRRKPERHDRPERSSRPPREDRSSRPGSSQRQDVLSGLATEWTVDTYDSDFRPAPPGEIDIKPLPRLARPPRKPRSAPDLEAARQALSDLRKPTTTIKGIGGAIAKNLENLGITSVHSLLNYLPRRYDDYTHLSTIRRLQPETMATVIGKVTHTEVRVGKGGRRDFFMLLEDGTGKINVTFFGQHFLVRNIRRGMQVVLSGKISAFRDSLQMTNPDWEQLDEENLHTIGVVPVYRLTEGVAERTFRRSMKRALDEWADRIPDIVPEATLERADLADIGWAMHNLHFPEGYDHLEHARRRYIFDHLLALQLAILQNRREWQDVAGKALEVTDEFLENFVQTVFPYELTNAQHRAIADIRRDVTQPVPMNRLIQGDVGSGKTAVAVTMMAMAVANGKQAALMAPTGILAEQHYRGIETLLTRMPGERVPVVALLTSALSTTERESVYRGLADGSIDVVIGTHALIQQGVEFHDLAVAVIDEQHRFGVQQRGRLRGKGSNPHLLVMTATPIPRTLALTMYADLDLSIIDEKPAGRQPIQTRLLDPVQRDVAFRFMEAQIEQGRQVFIVHPLVEASETNQDIRSAVEAYEELKQLFWRQKICLLHGRMKPAEKDDIMGAFARHEYDMMVTTSVAEVGVDIPNASVILIEGANRFGLAQLHQFRGRVGRGEHASFCLLMPDSENFESRERLEALVQTDDGFLLAEYDWKLRGAGDLLGTRQSGSMMMPLVDYITPELVSLAQREARTIYEEDPALELEKHALLAQRVQAMFTDEGDMS